jgi:hypothetical protein
MSPEEYRIVQVAAHRLRQAAMEIPLEKYDEALAAIDGAEALGPILDPTLARAAQGRMAQDREAIAACRDLARLGR